MRNKFLTLCILTLFMSSVTVLFIAEAEAARSSRSSGSSSSSRSSKSSSSYKSNSSKSGGAKSSYNRNYGSQNRVRSHLSSTFSPSGFARPTSLSGIATRTTKGVPSTYSKPGLFSSAFKKKKKGGHDDDDDMFDDALIGAALGVGAGSFLGYLLNDDDDYDGLESDEEEGGTGGILLFAIWIVFIILIKIARSYYKKKRVSDGRLERKLRKAQNRKEEASC